MVCPMRVLLVVVSTMVAGYLTWRSWKSSNEEMRLSFREEMDEDECFSSESDVSTPSSKESSFSLTAFLRRLCLALFDMGSGRYLYKALVTPGNEKQTKVQ